ncbi:MAG TPA: GNAT family N-acetyltransferase [Acidobacteriaceae bacterium]|nr:GNAT family N-acetyltransferase [Acidobacteriaceae bacterium]
MSDGLQLKIRPIRQEDAGAVAELVAQLGYERTPEQVRGWVRDLDSRSGQACFVAELNGEVVAWMDVSLEHHLQSEVSGLIGGLVVKDGLRGAGIGRRLCERAEDWSRRQGAKKIRVTSRSTREAAHRFYLRDGYRQTKISMVFEKALQPRGPAMP